MKIFHAYEILFLTFLFCRHNDFYICEVPKRGQFLQVDDIAVLLIAHPRKSPDGSPLTNESISGSGDITNRVDTVITYTKIKDQADCGKIGVVKNRLTGNVADNIEVQYGKRSKRISCNNVERDKVFGCFKSADPKDDLDLPPFY